MRMVDWAGGTDSGRIAVQVVGDDYMDGNTLKIRNRRVELRLTGDETLDGLELVGTEAAELAKLLTTAAARLIDD